MQTADRTAETGRHLVVRLGGTAFGIDVMQVREIAAMQTITAVPGTARAAKGVANLHGKVVPVVDLRTKLGVDEGDVTPATCLVVVRTRDERTTALLVDEVVEVMRTNDADAVLDLERLLGERSEG